MLTTWLACSNTAKSRKPLKLAGVPQTGKPISAVSGPKFTILCGTSCCLTSFFPIVDTYLSCEDITRQSCAMVPRWQFLATFCVLCFQRAACSTFQTCILNSYWGHIMRGSMADIQSVTAEIRRGKKEEERKRNHRMKIQWSALFYSAIIINSVRSQKLIYHFAIKRHLNTPWRPWTCDMVLVPMHRCRCYQVMLSRGIWFSHTSLYKTDNTTRKQTAQYFTSLPEYFPSWSQTWLTS